MTFDLEAIRKSDCPNLWHRLMPVGKLVNGQLIVPDAVAEPILADCHKLRGLGDVVAMVAQPIARAIDSVAGTNIKECGGCAKRREKLNLLLPLK
jgi:hypothetical protein